MFTFRRADLEAAGLQILATHRTPDATLAAANADQLVEMLQSRPHGCMQNPHHEPEGQEDQP